MTMRPALLHQAENLYMNIVIGPEQNSSQLYNILIICNSFIITLQFRNDQALPSPFLPIYTFSPLLSHRFITPPTLLPSLFPVSLSISFTVVAIIINNSENTYNSNNET